MKSEQPAWVMEISGQDSTRLIRLIGRLDSIHLKEVEAALEAELEGDLKALTFDLEAVTFLGSSFIRLVIDATKAMGTEAIHIINAHPHLCEALVIGGLEKVIQSDLTDPRQGASLSGRYPVDPALKERAFIGKADYDALYQQSIKDPDRFWREQALSLLDWDQTFKTVSSADFRTGEIQWFKEGRLNASVNCLDRHLETRGDQVALLFEGDEPHMIRRITYRELHGEVCRLANVLKAKGVTAGDRVCLYVPMIPEGAIAMLACARIGAVHSVVFGGFSAEALKDRILDAGCRHVICADEGRRGGKPVPLKRQVDEALQSCPEVTSVIVIRHTGGPIEWTRDRDLWYHEAMAEAEPISEPVSMNAEDPLFILYTSGSTGKPKGVLHTTGGYLVHASLSHRAVFDLREGDIYWCTADLGWVTGHSYGVYGPLLNGATTLLFEGTPTYPDPGRFWDVIERHRVNIFYTAPTAIRALMGHGNQWVHAHRLESLRILGSVGEPINPEAWSWYYHVVGDSRCPIVDTWWQTETGGIMITPLIGVTDLKPGSAGLPFFGVEPAILNEAAQPIEGPGEGVLVIKNSWPGQARTLYKDPDRFFETYLAPYPGVYFTGDGARRDEDGFYWITGRVDDVINISGHRLGTAEIESALVLHPKVVEAAVVGYPHPIKGQGLYAFVTLVLDVVPDDALKNELMALVRHEIGAIAKPEVIQWAPQLPKTRSGKIMRRVLRKIAAREVDQLGDLSTLADASVIADILEARSLL